MDLMTIEEVAEETRIPVNTLRYWRSRGTGPKSFSVGRRVRYRRGDVAAWLEVQYASSDEARA